MLRTTKQATCISIFCGRKAKYQKSRNIANAEMQKGLIQSRSLHERFRSLLFKDRFQSNLMDHLHYRLNFDLNKSRQKFHHSLKERHKISNIPKFRCEML